MVLWQILSLVVPTEAFIRHLCNEELGFGRVDPIMSPGKAAQHLHALHGSGNLGIDSTDADYLLEANCTSCSITADKSGYWAPAMYFQHDNGNLDLMNTSGGVTVYYKLEKRVNFEDQNYTVFPKGFRMIAGDSLKRNWVGPWPVPAQSLWGPNDTNQAALATKSIGFNCLNYITNIEEPSFGTPWLRNKTFIDAACPDGIRAEVLFPSCWDGVNLDSPNHKDHVAYPTLLQDGACPSSHPVYLPILFYETIWNTPYFKDVPGQFVLANGDPTGYGYHGDFVAAWEDGVLERIMQDPTCTDHDINHRTTTGLQEECQVVAPTLQSKEEAAQCRLQTPEILEHEEITDLTTLPGNMPITGRRHEPGTDPLDGRVQPNSPPDSLTMPPPSPMVISSTVSSVAPASSSHIFVETSSTITPSSIVQPSASIPKTTATPSVMPSSPEMSLATATNMSSSSSLNITAPAITTPARTESSVAATSIYTSGSMIFEIDIVEEVITLITSVTPTSTTSMVGRYHLHGGRHNNIA